LKDRFRRFTRFRRFRWFAGFTEVLRSNRNLGNHVNPSEL